MNLFEEEVKSFKPKEKKNKKIKITTLLIIAIAVFMILAILIVIAISYLRGSILTISLDGQKIDDAILEAIKLNDDGTAEISIKKMASYLNYQIYGGDYETLLEDSNKGYLQYNKQITTYENGSNKINQYNIDNESTQQKEEIKLKEAIKDISGDMYVNSDDAEKILSIYFSYNKNKNNIEIDTLDYLYNFYENYYAKKNGYIKIENVTNQNKKTVLDNMLIVEDTSGNYGVINIENGEIILEIKYTAIEYLRSDSEFLITRGEKKGIISSNKNVKLENYDNIDIITLNESKYYLITQNSKYGLANSNGNILIYPEYTKIGIEKEKFSSNDITNNYLVADTYIPLQKDKIYTLYNIKTQQLLKDQYTNLGYISKSSNIYSTIQVPEFGLVVVQKDAKYDLITQDGNNLFGYVLDSVYFTVSAGKKTYYIEYNNNAIELLTYLDEKGIKRVK